MQKENAFIQVFDDLVLFLVNYFLGMQLVDDINQLQGLLRINIYNHTYCYTEKQYVKRWNEHIHKQCENIPWQHILYKTFNQATQDDVEVDDMNDVEVPFIQEWKQYAEA